MTAPVGQITYTEQPPEEMTYEEYLAAVTAIAAALAATVTAISLPFQAIALTRSDWLSFLAATYPYVEQARWEIAGLSRRYYDSERATHVPPVRLPIFGTEEIIGPDGRPIRFEGDLEQFGLFYPRLNINLAPYEPDWYEEAMEAVVDELIKAGTTDNGLARVVSQTVKEAENGGRRTAMWAVDDDPDVFGWARVEGNENIGSCAFCAMLISRGPVYKRARQSGFNVNSEAVAVEKARQAEASGDGIPLDLMTKWHPNCDCKVVPVFDPLNWQGRDMYLYYEKLWSDVTGPYKGGKKGGEKLKVFRQFLAETNGRDSTSRVAA